MKRMLWMVLAGVLVTGPVLAQSAQPDTETDGSAAVASSGSGSGEEVGYDVRLRSLQERVDDLKSRVFDSKTKLMLLREQILHNLIAESRAVIMHVNDMSSSLVLDEVIYYLDNEKVYYQNNRDGSLSRTDEFPIYSDSLAPGNHLLSVEMVYRGNGTLFTYLSGYVFKVKSSFTFFATKGQESRIRVVGFEKGGMAAPLEDRPSVRFELQQRKVVADAPQEDVGESGASESGK